MPQWPRPNWAHRTDVFVEANAVRIRCRPPGGGTCDFGGRYPRDSEHARVIADNHVIATHETGAEPCGRAYCWGDAAIRRKRKREESA